MRPIVIVVPKKLTHCPVCGLAITLDASIRLRATKNETLPKGQTDLERMPETAEMDSDG